MAGQIGQLPDADHGRGRHRARSAGARSHGTHEERVMHLNEVMMWRSVELYRGMPDPAPARPTHPVPARRSRRVKVALGDGHLLRHG
jgi:hypothetical protein